MSENVELTFDDVALNDPPMAGMAVVDVGDFVPFLTLEFTVGEDGSITEGMIRIYTVWVGMPINLAQTLGDQGCRFSFEDFIVGDDVVTGTFTSSSEASGTINNVETCVIGSEKLTFTTPLTAEWVATPSTE